MGTDHTAIDIMHFPVQLSVRIFHLLQLGKNTIPHSTFLPAIETTSYRLPLPVAFGQITSGHTRPQYPDDPVDDHPVIQICPSRFRFLERQQRFQLFPLLIRQFMSFVAHKRAFYALLLSLQTRPSILRINPATLLRLHRGCTVFKGVQTCLVA